MENMIFKYLEILLPIHNCVVLPDFGGFIIHPRPASFNVNGEITQPGYSIVFNPGLKHNDGIIASYIIKDENISYNAASKKIKDCIKALISDLKSGKVISCANIGVLSTDQSGNISFSPNKANIYPALYGLQDVYLKQLSQINNDIIREKRNTSFKYYLGGIAATAAAILLFVGPSISIKDRGYHNTKQEASFISSVTSSLSSSTNLQETIIDKPISENTDNNKTITDTEVNIPSTRTYYIIIGGEESKVQANRLLNKIRSTDFPEAAIVESDRYRVYVSSFTDKKQAEDSLNIFREENPKYKTAWLYSKRN